MENNFTNCHHCGALNFHDQIYCNTCSFRLPVNEEKQSRYYKRWNKTIIQSIILMLVLGMALAFTVRII